MLLDRPPSARLHRLHISEARTRTLLRPLRISRRQPMPPEAHAPRLGGVTVAADGTLVAEGELPEEVRAMVAASASAASLASVDSDSRCS